MNPIRHAPLGAMALLALAAPAMIGQAYAQERDKADWSGPYVGGSIGYGFQNSSSRERLRFDTDGDGDLNDTVVTVPGGPNAFTGSCGNCGYDKDGWEWQVHAGFDKQFGSVVAGAVIEGGKAKVRDGVTGYTATDSYTLSRRLDWNGAVRARLGYSTPGGTLFYGTGGVAYGQIKNRFVTSNAVNGFAETGRKDKAWGWVVGGGVDQKISQNASIGLLYRYTRFNSDDYRVGVGPQTPAVVGDPFTTTPAGGTVIGRGEKKFDHHSIALTASYRF